MRPHFDDVDRESAPSRGAARGVGSGWHVEEIENFQLQWFELGLEDLDKLSVTGEVIALDTGEALVRLVLRDLRTRSSPTAPLTSRSNTEATSGFPSSRG